MNTDEDMLTVESAAKRLHLSVPQVYRLVANREIGYTRFRRAIRFTPAHVADYIRTHEVPAAK